MKVLQAFLCSTILASSAYLAPAYAADENPEPLRVFIRAGVDTHGPGAHLHEFFLKDWLVLLAERGATVDGAMQFPNPTQIENSDVIVFYAANAASISTEERELLDTFQKRGGGLVFIHDAVCGDDPQWFKTINGGAWEHGHSKWFEGPFNIILEDTEHPITKGAVNFHIDDEIYWDLHIHPDAHILATTDATRAPGSPQLWIHESGNSRSFTSLLGHWHSNFDLPHHRALLLRGIAWAGHRDADLLTTPDEIKGLGNPIEAKPVMANPE